jgi:SprT protein
MTEEKKRNQFSSILSKYLPDFFVSFVAELLLQNKVRFKIVAPRSTKLGDFRPGNSERLPQITVNGNLNPYSFLITTLHEFAHFKTFEKYSNNVNPHGIEWKNEFKILLEPLVSNPQFPQDLKRVISKSLNNLKASSCSDIHLSRELAKFDSEGDDFELLENLEHGSFFLLQNKIFYKGELRRKRFLCTEIQSQKKYLVNAIAKVKQIEK